MQRMSICAPRLTVCLAVVAVAAISMLPACSSTQHKELADHSSGKLEERTLKPNMNKISEFDKKFDTSSLGDRGAMKATGKKSFSTGDYKGNTIFKGSKDFKGKDFAQSAKTSREQTQVSGMGNKKEKSSDKVFATGDNRFSGKKAQDGNQVFNRSKQEFKTSDYAPGKKSLEDNKRPYFKPAGEVDKTKTAYSEQDVKALLNRN